MFNLLACRTLHLGPNSLIGRGNLLKGDFDFVAGPRLFMGNRNVVTCPWNLAARHPGRGYGTRVEFGADCLVNDRHYLDGHGRITVGDGSWIAGRDSQLYTHGIGAAGPRHTRSAAAASSAPPPASRRDRGSATAASSAWDRWSSTASATEAALVAGFPARAVRDISDALAAGRYRFSRDDWGADAP